MATTTIPKYKIAPAPLNEARKKLQCNKEPLQLSEDERRALLDLIAAGKKTLYPNQMSIDRYRYHLDQINKVVSLDNKVLALDKSPTRVKAEPHQFKLFAEKIEEFEKKYCV